MVYGYSAVCVRIDLTTSTIKKEILSDDFLRTYIGGYGFVTKILWDEVKPGMDAFDPANPLIWAIGPFPGTIVPTSSKYVRWRLNRLQLDASALESVLVLSVPKCDERVIK